MIYAYIRVSSDKQTTENQRFEVNNYCKKLSIKIDEWCEETISGTKKASERLLGAFLKKMGKEDKLIVCELSRLGRNIMEIMSILNTCMNNDIKVIAIKENYELGNNINSKVLAFAFGLSAEIERNLISMRTKEALARKKSEGVVLGRPKGSNARAFKLEGRDEEIQKLLDNKISISGIARLLGCHRMTVSSFLEKNNIKSNGRK
jgi:DNA invertase Pin-like site-specific DNA recombinase